MESRKFHGTLNSRRPTEGPPLRTRTRAMAKSLVMAGASSRTKEGHESFQRPRCAVLRQWATELLGWGWVLLTSFVSYVRELL